MMRECDRDDVNELLDRLDRTDNWAVEDWDFSVGRFEEPVVELTLQWSPPLPKETMQAAKETIRQHEGPEGMPVEAVKDELSDYDDVDRALENLKRMGEVYEPTTDHLRVA